jgi:CYTH domain-containing protein
MSREIEIEKTYLAKFLPSDLFKSKSVKMVDLYIPKESEHCKLRIRQKDDSYTITKKTVVKPGDSSVQTEDNIIINAAEFKALNKIRGHRLEKTRYFYSYGGRTAEIDVFSGALKGLALVDFEFSSKKEADDF